jgi:radical SAM superfamily enzyme YgiQ (UPF0313 family)
MYSLKRIAFASPNPRPKFEFQIGPPLSLMMLAACIRQMFPTVEIKIFDGSTEKDVKTKILEFAPDFVGVTATSPQIVDAYTLLDEIRTSNPDIFLAIGGPHVSALPEEACLHADVVVVGEGENAILQIIQALLDEDAVPSIVYGEPVEVLDSLPRPAYDLLDMGKYIYSVLGREDYWKVSGHQNDIYPMVRLMTSRGCNYRCPFCGNSRRTSKVRYFSADRIIDDIQFLITNYHVHSLWFDDDDFLANKKRLCQFIGLFKAKGWDKRLTWACEARVNDITSDVVELIKSAGCILVFLGVESYSQRSLAYLKCNTVTKQTVDDALEICHSNGLSVCASFIFGSPGETLAEMNETLDWMKTHRSRGLTLCYGGILIVFPGTELYDYAVKNGIVNPVSFDYDKTSTTANPSDTYIVDKAVSLEDFKAFLDYAEAQMWLYNQVALRNWKALLTRTFRKYLFKHFADGLKIFGMLI